MKKGKTNTGSASIIGSGYETMDVPLNKIQTDFAYQRRREAGDVSKIVKNFDPSRFLPPVLNRRADGMYWVVDGQLRCMAARIMGHTVIRAQVLTKSLNMTEEANLFSMLNARQKDGGPRAVKPLEQHRARCVAGDKDALAVAEVLESLGLKFVAGGSKRNSHAVGTLTAIFLCTDIVNSSIGKSGLRDVLTIAKDSWGGDSRGFQVRIVQGIRHIICCYRTIDKRRLVEVLSRTRPETLTGRINSAVDSFGGNPFYVAAHFMVEMYNARLSEPKRLEVRDIYGATKPKESAPN